eukprot:1364557-Amphidinium_carterae.1
MIHSIAQGVPGWAVSFPSGLALAFWRRNVRRGFDFFICHHKADAAAQARLLKLLLVQHRSGCEIQLGIHPVVNPRRM